MKQIQSHLTVVILNQFSPLVMVLLSSKNTYPVITLNDVLLHQTKRKVLENSLNERY